MTRLSPLDATFQIDEEVEKVQEVEAVWEVQEVKWFNRMALSYEQKREMDEGSGIGDRPSILRSGLTEVRHAFTKAKGTRELCRVCRCRGEARPSGELYMAQEGCILGSEEFVDATIHHVWESDSKPKQGSKPPVDKFDPERLISSAEKVFELSREEFCGPRKSTRIILAKECLIASGTRAGATLSMLAKITGLSSATTSKRHEAALKKMREGGDFRKLVNDVFAEYQRIEESKA